MKVSFTIIAYNEEKNIANCINSILNQEGLEDHEIVIVNDGSKDKTSKIIKDLQKKNKKIRFFDFKENKGRGFARYTAVKNAKGDYIAFVDADCILPNNWLKTCLENINNGFDAVGGIAVPDGDAAYIYKKFKLVPKIVPHTTDTSGSNSLFKREVFDKIKPNFNLTSGYDIDLNTRMKKIGFKTFQIKELVVRHEEDITYKKSLRRMRTFGEESMRMFFRFKKIRLPDLTFLGFILLLISSFFYFPLVIFLIIYPFVVGLFHLWPKFEKKNKALKFILAALVNYTFMLAYFYGRILGFFRK